MPLWTHPGPTPEELVAEREVLDALGLTPGAHAVVRLGPENHVGGRITLVHRTTGNEYTVVIPGEQWQRIVNIMDKHSAIVVDCRRRPEHPHE